MKTRSVKKNIILNTFYNILRIITPFITAPYTARVLGAEAIGEYSFLSSISSYFVVFIGLGTIVYGTIEISKNRDDDYTRSKVFWEIESLTFVTSTIAIIVWTFLLFLTSGNKIYYFILYLELFAACFDISWFYAGLEHYEYAVVQSSVTRILVVVLLFVFVKSPKDLWIYIVLMSGGTFLSSVLFWSHLPKYLVRVKLKDLKITRHIKGTIIFFIPSIANTLYTMLDRTIIGIASTSAENGYYLQASSILTLIQTLCFAGLNSVLMSRNSYLYEKGLKSEIKNKISLSVDFILFLGVAACFGIWAVASKFVPLFFGAGYARTVYILFTLVPIVPVIGLSNCLGGQYYNPAGLRAKSTKYLIVGIVINLVLNCILIPYYGGIGAAIASVISELVATILYVVNSDGYCSIKMIAKKIWKKILAGLIMFATIYPVGKFINNDIVAIIVQVFVGIIVYIIVLILLKDKEIIDILLGKIISIVKGKIKKS